MRASSWPEAVGPGPLNRFGRAAAWRDRTLASPAFRAWATRFPLTRPIARRRSRALFDLCAGFVYSQVLLACVELRVFDLLAEGPGSAEELAPRLGLSVERTERLLGAAVSLRLLRRRRGGFGLGPLGAAVVGNGGVVAMVRHHVLLYADLADPVAALRAAPGGTRLAAYWPYAGSAPVDSLGVTDVAGYSALMAASQPLVTAEILNAYDIRPHRRLLDVGGGDGTFLLAAGARAPDLRLMLFDLPAVAEPARARLGGRAEVFGGDMRADALPRGADLITLIRVVHDHDDSAALTILRAVRAALAPDGTLLLAEPMAESRGAQTVGAAYFAMYLMALGSGRARTEKALGELLRMAGFSRVQARGTANPLVTGLIVAQP